MELNGIDLQSLEEKGLHFPPMVPGRVLQIDADFLAYHVTYEKEDEEKSFEDMQHNCRTIADTLRKRAGAETHVLHLTPKESDKGKRPEQAMFQAYQENREGKPKPRFLHVMREWMHKEMGAVLHFNKEADDGMATAQYKDVQNSVIASKDKDLRMVTGTHLNWDTGELTTVEGFGEIYLDKSGSSTTLKGYGYAFFWAQMLMGDAVDNIKGLPKITGSALNRIKTTKTIEAAQAVLKSAASTDKQKVSAQKKLDARKAGLCGVVMAHDIVTRCGSNKKAFQVVKYLYEEYGREFGFENYRTCKTITPGAAFTSEAQLLWMRRNDNPLDVLDWIKEDCT